jgi:hypothetical protein
MKPARFQITLRNQQARFVRREALGCPHKTFIIAVMHKAQVRLEAGESCIEIEIEIVIEIDSVQFYASV